ncbi:MAG TPA: GNAT family N-acetyltransferase [Mycobacteriales bacterium]|nr:GNAT family N-acetyltransferase [Mycobacteriales bacterium]
MTLLDDWLEEFLGQWPPRSPFDVVGSPLRAAPAWDGTDRPVTGVSAPGLGAVLSVPPRAVDAVRALGDDWHAPDYGARLAGVLGLEPSTWVLDGTGVFRWADHVAPLEPLGEWVDPEDARVPPWLRPFNGGVLCAWDDDGSYVAGVGIKRHSDLGEEIAVGTEPAARGRGYARRLVVTAAHAILERGAVPTYLHAPDNVASAHVAEASGFADRGWRFLGLWTRDALHS